MLDQLINMLKPGSNRKIGQLKRISKTIPKGNGSFKWIFALIIGFISGLTYIEFDKASWYEIGTSGEINICFTPPSGCGELISREISKAKSSLFVQAYSFTSRKIIAAIIEAKSRGIEVNILLDKSNLTDQYSKLPLIQGVSGINIRIDKAPGIAHNKVMIIDKKKVITGSFNFSNDADKRNAENVLLINNQQVAQHFLDNWYSRYNKSHAVSEQFN